MTSYIQYFAYGSNMCVARLRGRVPSAKPIGTYKLEKYRLCFHKRSKDESGKCNAYKTDDCSDFVMGRLFRIKESEKKALHKAEGKGYDKKWVTVVDAEGNTEEAYTYCAFPEFIDDCLCPYTWYKECVLVGARDAPLPSDYIEKIEAVVAKREQDCQVKSKRN